MANDEAVNFVLGVDAKEWAAFKALLEKGAVLFPGPTLEPPPGERVGLFPEAARRAWPQWADREPPESRPLDSAGRDEDGFQWVEEKAPEAPGPTTGRRAIVREGEPEV